MTPTEQTQRLFHQAVFFTSAQTLAQCPPDSGAEVAFAGRSNAGKSSAINCLTGQNRLARTSKTPGRTQLINFFQLDESRRLVDLPGYGFAKVEREKRLQWQRHLDDYLSRRMSLVGLVIMMDCRHPVKPFDTTLLDWAQKADLPVHVLLTKADKLSFGAAKQTLLTVQRQLSHYNNPLSLQLFSATAKTGDQQAWELLSQWLQVGASTP